MVDAAVAASIATTTTSTYWPIRTTTATANKTATLLATFITLTLNPHRKVSRGTFHHKHAPISIAPLRFGMVSLAVTLSWSRYQFIASRMSTLSQTSNDADNAVGWFVRSSIIHSNPN